MLNQSVVMMKDQLSPALLLVTQRIFDLLQLKLEQYFPETESAAYSACGFHLNRQAIRFRMAKVTPKKIGLFVTLWKRNVAGVTAPFSANDQIDFVMIFANTAFGKGLFVFPKALLIEKKIFSTNKSAGKRGFRIYPPWDLALSIQARESQAWQVNYFIDFNTADSVDHQKLARLGFAGLANL